MSKPIELPEEAVVETPLPEPEEECAHIEGEIEESAAEIERGEHEEARSFALRLIARS